MSHVHFRCDQSHIGVFPEPVPAVRKAPSYYKNIKPQTTPHPASTTVKRCVPFLDALSAGYIIPLWADVFVTAKDGTISIDFPKTLPMRESLGSHGYQQIENHPMAETPYGKIPLKFINPWLVETEPGISCLFTAPLNHMETRFKLLDGIVDTDTYYNNVNFPFIWTGGDGTFTLAKGTPLVQVIPFRRESYTMSVSAIDQQQKDKVNGILGTQHTRAYRDNFWSGRRDDTKEED